MKTHLWPEKKSFLNTKVVCAEVGTMQNMRVVEVSNLNFKTKAF